MKNRSSTKTIKSCKFPPTNVLCKITNRTVSTSLYRLTQKRAANKTIGHQARLSGKLPQHKTKPSISHKKKKPHRKQDKKFCSRYLGTSKNKKHTEHYFFFCVKRRKNSADKHHNPRVKLLCRARKTEILCRKIQFLLSLFLIPPRNSGY